MKPSNDPKADQLINSNISQPNDSVASSDEEMSPENDTENDDVSLMDIPISELN